LGCKVCGWLTIFGSPPVPVEHFPRGHRVEHVVPAMPLIFINGAGDGDGKFSLFFIGFSRFFFLLFDLI